MRKIYCLALGILIALNGFGQYPANAGWEFGAGAGVMLGGPIPSEQNPDSSSGKMTIGPAVGVWASHTLAKRWAVSAGIEYAFKGATYQQLMQRDTNMVIELFPGVVDTVPTYYLGDIRGKMALHYLELPVQVHWLARPHMRVDAGLYMSALVGGSDAGTIAVQIGNGQVFPDTTVAYENYPFLRKLDYGICLGGSYRWRSGLYVEFRAQRSLRGLYDPVFSEQQGLGDVRLYHTQMRLTVGWRWRPAPREDAIRYD